jgi:aldehyde:ferredoxin oxidoreductase
MIFVDCLGNCRFPSGLNHSLLTEAASVVTGWDLSMEETKNVGLRAINLMKIFNLRAGITKAYDAPSERYSSTPIDGPTKGVSIEPHWDSMLRSYYKLMGWNEDTGVPLPETLRNLDLGHTLKDIP